MKIIFLLLLPFISKSQAFEKSKNTFLQEAYVRYYDRDAGILIQKAIATNNDTSFIRYELGLIVFRRGRSSDDFMERSSVIVFEDRTYLMFTDPISINYFQEGRHQYSVKHILTPSELEILQAKKIDHIAVASKENVVDKWQAQKVLKAFSEIINQ